MHDVPLFPGRQHGVGSSDGPGVVVLSLGEGIFSKSSISLPYLFRSAPIRYAMARYSSMAPSLHLEYLYVTLRRSPVHFVHNSLQFLGEFCTFFRRILYVYAHLSAMVLHPRLKNSALRVKNSAPPKELTQRIL
jgi:hypothetical protein